MDKTVRVGSGKMRMKSKDFQVVIQCLIVIDGKNKPTTKRSIPINLHTLRIPIERDKQ